MSRARVSWLLCMALAVFELAIGGNQVAVYTAAGLVIMGLEQ